MHNWYLRWSGRRDREKNLHYSSLTSEVDKDFKPSSMALKRPEPHPHYYFRSISSPSSLGINSIPEDRQSHLLFGLWCSLVTSILLGGPPIAHVKLNLPPRYSVRTALTFPAVERSLSTACPIISLHACLAPHLKPFAGQ